MSVTFVRRVFAPVLLLALLALPAAARADVTETSIVRAMNSVRAANHLPRLHSNPGLARAADVQSAHVLRTGVLAHGSFSSRVHRYVHSRELGENLAWASSCDPSAIVQLWLSSAAHRDIMLSSDFRRVGVGARSAAGVCVVTADFASAH